jgi:hypothetical protein
MTSLYFHDLPVYRLPEAPYSVWLSRQVAHLLAQTFLGVPAPTPVCVKGTKRVIEKQCNEKYGSWQFNEIVGYIRLRFVGQQVWGEYYGSSNRMPKRSRNKVFTYKLNKLPAEKDIPVGATNSQIFRAVKQYVNDCAVELPKLYLDDEWLDRVGPMMDWNAVMQASSREVVRKRAAE